MAADDDFKPEHIELMKSVLIEHVPHAKAIGLTVVDAKRGQAWLSVPYAENLIGNPETGVIHGGVITSLLDNACGIAVQLALPERMSIATLDLRLDYMKPATPKLDLMAHTHCYKVTKNIAFVRGTAYHTDEEDPIATCVGTFMLAANRAVPMPISPETVDEAMKLLAKNKDGAA
ncbi:PaaI family thioesterase [Parvibaculum sp.]|uniref:PaaI family thioesterase n=1 Tax=Parvibaculum sp. TaxID=2024848 RepID=UPI002730F71E|nr:PaaI family thioesterase [Parvibaculum sp.]MDP1626474.1 PaaI family thioesterase [Parvibaculum sp.]MDP2150396.1 PaaI family thioesterase [Parvibaculum sp.]MDP3326848.1 PaaI family thioesterase [Parvibaculum sp.]